MFKIFTLPLTNRSEGHKKVYQLLKWQYEALTGQAMPPVVTMKRGKPAWEGGGLQFNLSHTRSMAVCAISDSSVGVDVEHIRAVTPGLILRVLSGEERSWVLRQPDQKAAVMTLWTLKEAYVKYTGQGLRGIPKSVNFTMGDKISLPSDPQALFGTRQAGTCVVSWCIGSEQQTREPQWIHCQRIPGVYARLDPEFVSEIETP